MARVMGYLKWLPALYAAVKVIWSMYKSKVRADGYKEALKDEQRRRVKAESSIALRERLASSDEIRLARLKREAKERAD